MEWEVVLLLLLAATPSAHAGSIRWEWWDGNRSCLAGDTSENQEWTWEYTCLRAKDLQAGDPLARFTELSGRDVYINLHCFDERVDKNPAYKWQSESIVIQAFEEAEGTGACQGSPLASIQVKTMDCNGFADAASDTNENVTRAMMDILVGIGSVKIYCSACTWVFLGEDPPPYLLLASGILVFLVACLFINVVLREHLDKFVQQRHKLLPSIFGHAPAFCHDLEVRPGCLVWITPLSQIEREGFGHSSQAQSVMETGSMDSPKGVRLERRLAVVESDEEPVSPEVVSVVKKLTTAPVNRAPPSEGEGQQVSAASAASDPLERALASDMLDIVSALEKDDSSASATYNSPSYGRGARLAPVFEHQSPLAPVSERRRRYPRDEATEPLLKSAYPVSMHPESALSNNGDVVSRYSQHRTTWDEACGESDVVQEYMTHSTATSPQGAQPTRFPLTSDDPSNIYLSIKDTRAPGTSLVVTEALKPPPKTGLWPKKIRQKRRPVGLKHCVVCGHVEDAQNKMEKREQGWKCVGNKHTTCIGKKSNTRLLRTQIPEGLSDKEAQLCCLEGQLGQYGDVLAMRVMIVKERYTQRQALINFTTPTAWLPAHLIEKLGDHCHGTVGSEGGRARLYVSAEKEPFWERLCSMHGYTRLETVGQWTAIKLEADVAVWLPIIALQKVGDFYGNYVRAGEAHETRDASFTSWEEWYADFALCVGKVIDIRRVVKGEVRFFVVVRFDSSAVITFPAETLRHCTRDEYQMESLDVPQPIVERTVLAVYVVHPVLLGIKALFLTAYFIYSVVVSTSDGHMGRASRHNPWEAYEEVYFRLFNSGYPTLMADFGAVFVYRMTHQDATVPQMLHTLGKPVLGMVFLTLLISLPGLLTHVIPMIFYYGWMWLPIFAVVFALFKMGKKLAPIPPKVEEERRFDKQYYLENHKGFLIRSAVYHTLYRFCAEFAAVIFLQTNFNYAVLTYDSITGYFDTIPYEYNLRTYSCILEQATKMATLMW